MNILVTGGAGFIGSHTTDELIRHNHSVIVLDNLERQVHPKREPPSYLNDKAEYVWGDISKKSTWRNIFNSFDLDSIIHLAGRVGIAQSMYEPSHYIKVNSLGTALLYQVLIENPEIMRRIKKIIVASSKTIYGEGSYNCSTCGMTIYPGMRKESDLKNKIWDFYCPCCNHTLEPVGIREEKPPQNLSIYALTKYDTERMAMNFAETYNLPTIAFRYFNVYGPRQSLSNPYTGVSAIFSSRIKNESPVILFEDGNQLRDFIFVEDIARVNTTAVESGATGVFNIGTGKPHSIFDIAQTLKTIFQSDVPLTVTQEYRKGDTRHDFADIGKARNELSFEPETDLFTGLKKLVEWSECETAEDKFEQAERERIRFIR